VRTVPSADDYRELADKCFKSARVAHTEDERMMYLGVTYRRFPYAWL
jgi:hypothetical protein